MEVGLRAELDGDKSKKGKLKKGRKEAAHGIKALFLFNRSSPTLNSVVTFIVLSVMDTQSRAKHFC